MTAKIGEEHKGFRIILHAAQSRIDGRFFPTVQIRDLADPSGPQIPVPLADPRHFNDEDECFAYALTEAKKHIDELSAQDK
jgi:hypothetical protein